MTKELDSTQDADLRESYRRCDVSNNGTDNPIGEDEFVSIIKANMIAYADQVIGPDDPVQLASDAPGHIRYIQQVERNKLRSEQRKRNKA